MVDVKELLDTALWGRLYLAGGDHLYITLSGFRIDGLCDFFSVTQGG